MNLLHINFDQIRYFTFLFISFMLQPIFKVEELSHNSNPYFYDHLNDELYFIRQGQLYKTIGGDMKSATKVSLKIHQHHNPENRFPCLQKLKGQCKLNLQRNFFTTESDSECTVKTDVEITNGSVWQWHIAGSLKKVKLGIVQQTKSNNIFETFVDIFASSSRTVTFSFLNGQLKTWVNGQVLTKDHIITINIDPKRESKFYVLASCKQKGQTLTFNPFAKIPSNSFNYQFRDSEVKPLISNQTNENKFQRLVQLDKDRFLVISSNGLGKVFNRNSQTSKFQFGAIEISQDGFISGLFSQEERKQLSQDKLVGQLWSSVKNPSQISSSDINLLIQKSLRIIQKQNAETQNSTYRILLKTMCLLRSLHREFNLTNVIYESQIDRQHYSQAFQAGFINLPLNPSNNISKATILNNEAWVKIDGKIQDISENYILSIDEQTVIIYHLGDRIKEVFRQNIVFFQFNKSSFLERYNEADLRILKKGEHTSSIYKLLMNCISKDKKTPTQTFQVKDKDLKEMTDDYRISQSDAKMSLMQTGNVQQALVWLSKTQDQRVYIEKPQDMKNKSADQELISGSLIELKNLPLARILLKINNQIYLLGYDPQNFNTNVTKGQKQFINLFNFKRQSNILQVDSLSWYDSQNHRALNIIDSLNIKQKNGFLFKEDGKIYLSTAVGPTLQKAEVIINSQAIFENQNSLALSDFIQFQNEQSITRNIQGQVFYDAKLTQAAKSSDNTVFIHKGQLYTNLRRNIQEIIEVEASVNEQSFSVTSNCQRYDQNFIPLVVVNGPPSCNHHYQISSILTPGGSYLANYPQSIKLKNLHSKYMRVSSVIIERYHKKLTVNEVQKGNVYFVSESGIKSKGYNFTFSDGQTKVEINIQEKGFWKYIVLDPIFGNGKKMPFQFGFFGVKGALIQNEIYQNILSNLIKYSLILNQQEKIIPFQISQVSQVSNKVLKITLKPNQKQFSSKRNYQVQIKSLFKNIIKTNYRYCLKPELTKQQEHELESLKNISNLNGKEFNKLFSNPKLQNSIIKEIIKTNSFSFKNWEKAEVRKFMDLVFLKSGDLKKDVFTLLFDKIVACEEGHKYFMEQCQDLGKCYTAFPQNYLSYMLKKIEPLQHRQNLKDLLRQIPKYRSQKYKDLRKQKIPYLLLEQNFYSKYYLEQIQKLHQADQSSSEQKLPIFEQIEPISSQLVVIRDQISRKIYAKLDGQHLISSIVLRFDRTQISSKIHFKIYSLNSQNKTLIKNGMISENQWNQVTRNSHNSPNKQFFNNNLSSLNAYAIDLNGAAVKASLLEIQILYNQTGISANQNDSKNFPFIDILPEIYGQSSASKQKENENLHFSGVMDMLTFMEQQSFYLSSVDIGIIPFEKYSISKQNQYEYSYFKPADQKIDLLSRTLSQKIQSKDFSGAISDHKKLVSTYKKHSRKPSLDYLYTTLLFTLEQIFSHQIKINEDLCKELFQLIIKEEVGPIRIAAFKATSHCINYLIKSLPYIQEEGYLPNLQKTTFDQKQIQKVLDLRNAPLCNSLNKLVVNSIPYNDEWAKFLIKITPVTQKYQENIKYIIKSNSWFNVSEVLTFFAQIPENYFKTVLLTNIDGTSLQKYILESKRIGKTSRTHLLVEKLIQTYNGKIDLDVVSMMLQDKDVYWHNLYKIIKRCPQAEDLILTQYLQLGETKAANLAENYPQILNLCAKSQKHSENVAAFFSQLFSTNRRVFKKSILSLSQDSLHFHSDILQVLAFYLYEECNFGGVQGSKILQEQQLVNLHVAQILLKKISQASMDEASVKQFNQQDILIEWYFCNNSYENVTVNPANKSPGLHLMKNLSQKVLQLIQNRSIDKILKVFDRLIAQIQIEHIPLSTKHIYINQINQGVYHLLGKSINPTSLSEILIHGENNTMLKRIFESLQSLNSKSIGQQDQNQTIWKGKQTEFIEKFSQTTSLKQKIKDWQANRSGTKNILFKVPVNQKRILLQSSGTQAFTLSKILIGFNGADNNEKNNIYPREVQVYGGQDENSLVKICDLKQIRDQHFECFGTRVYGINFNSLPFRKCASSIHILQFRMAEPLLTSLSDVFQNSQKIKKQAFYSVSFLSLMGYQAQPKNDPAYNQIYMTLLSFLSDQKYKETLRKVIQTPYYKQKSHFILRLLNSLLPNKQIENLLLALNRENQDVLGSIFENGSPNLQLVQSLLEANPSSQNIKKLLNNFAGNHFEKLTSIIISSIKLFSYTSPVEKISFKIEDLIKSYESSNFKRSIFDVLTAILSTSATFNTDYDSLLQTFWNKQQTVKHHFYKIIGSTIAYYSSSLDKFLQSGKTQQLSNQLINLLNKKDSNIDGHIYLLSQLCLHQKNREYIIKNLIPLTIVNALRNEETLLNKEYGSAMKYFILLFQSTCIQSSCEERFSQILIQMMVKLPQVPAAHHNFFIHEFFFPLINAFKGIPVKFVWKNSQGNYLYQATHSLKTNPIKCNQNVIVVNGLYLQKAPLNSWSIVSDKSNYKVLNKNNQIIANQNVQLSEQPECEYQLFKIVNEQNSNLLTNQTMIRLKNIGIFGSNYQNVVPVQDSTYQNIYYIPCEMTLQDVLKQANICGFRLNDQAVKQTNFINWNSKDKAFLGKTFSLEQIFSNQQKHLAILEVNPETLFSNTSIENIAKNAVQPHVFIPQQTIFKAFQRKEGLMKMIKVLKTCVKNWTNSQQSKIWEQYLNQLQSYSCFPVFSSIYMNKQENVQLLFSILSGLPDKQDSKKWIDLQKSSVKFLYSIIKDVFQVEGSKALQIRKYAVQNGFYKTMLQRLHLVTKQPKRVKVQNVEEQEEFTIPTNLNKINSEDDYKLKVVKKKGIGYGTDSSSNQKWDLVGQQQSKKELGNQVLDLLKMLEKFLDHKMFEPSKEIVQQSYESALLPLLESSLRGGSLLQISKSADLFKGELSFIKALTKKKALIPILMSLPKIYEPKQHESIFQLLKILEGTSRIFLSCLTGSVSQKLSEEIAKSIIQTYEMVEQAVSNYQMDHVDEDQQKKILQLPLAKKYPILLKDLRFDYIDMKDKTGKITKHHYSSNYAPNHKAPPAKTIRLAQQLADISHALPVEHTNAIYVRCDKQRVDFMQALIMGSNGTPYGHGAYLFDIYFDDSYPNNPPKVNLTTTGNGQIRFNPNLYSCGKVCLSLLGTWRGSAMQNWDAKVSTLLQILVSIQSIIMSEQVYFNEPGFEHEQGTIQGQKKNEAYANIVRYGNIKFAMIQNMKNPPKGFQNIIKRHFYLKKDQILEQTKKWSKYAEKRQASYTGLISDHNNNWCNTFKKSKNEYKNMLQKAIKQLEQELNKLPEPSNKDLKTMSSPKKEKKKQVKFQSKDQNIEQVDVTYDKNQQNNLKQLDINDEKVKDRWSRYIGAMGIEAVSKQSKASILLFGLGATGVQIAKNLILSGCKKMSISDDQNVQITDLAGQFFVGEQDLGTNRVQACLYKLQQLNHYVRVENLKFQDENLEVLKQYDVVILTEQNLTRQKLINAYCRENGIKFIITDCYGPFGQHFNDFGTDFEVLDKNGEQTVQVMIQSITNAQKGVVTLLNKQRHPYQDGEAVRINGVKGMGKQNGESINGTIHKIRVINQYSFEIGDTTGYSPYEIDGIARNMKLPIKVQFKSLEQSLKLRNIDGNLAFYDFEKGTKNQILHKCFITLSTFRQTQKRFPHPWNWQDGELFLNLLKVIHSEELKAGQINFIRTFSYTCSGTFAPLAAFYGGLTAQQAFKAITGKYMPINQYFFTEFTEVVPSLPEKDEDVKLLLEKLNYKQSKDNRNQGLRRIVGDQLNQKLQKCRVFLIGSGAIGCELLKNYAMINLATSKQGGQIIVTDPDHIQESNLNRQFLFRQKHLRKPKSVTAAAAVAQMNKLLKGKIRAKLDRVCQSTKDTFSNEFFQSLNIVTNALDNVKARQYVDQRCVENKVALLQSGTLSSKGHVQVIIPYLTQTYGSKNDPAQDGEIPHCTLKMFPEETLHCVEWARDIFGKTFTLDPKALSKLVEKLNEYNPNASDLEMLKSCLKMLEKRPRSFEEAILIATNKFFQLYNNDIKQLLYTYPLDAKTKDGKPFWKLPKRPPTPIEEINPENQLHYTFISSYAVLLCKIFGVEYPKDFRKQQRRVQICKEAAKIKIEPFVPNDKLAKQMAEQVDKDEKGEQKQKMKQDDGEVELQQEVIFDQNTLFKNIKDSLSLNSTETKVTPEEFEKDDDQNGHIDLIYSMANLRADNYKLEPMDWMTTKLKAGRITPALSTTTSCIAALQTIQLIKYLKQCKLTAMRNTFINLAVPMVQATEPGQVQKIKIHEDLNTNVWQRWEAGPVNLEKITLGELIEIIEKKYKIQVKILSVLQAGQIYSDIVLGLQSKKQQKQEHLKKPLKELLLNEISAEEIKRFVDLTLVFGVNDVLAKHVPTIRIKFQ